jgi:hypothetical protein
MGEGKAMGNKKWIASVAVAVAAVLATYESVSADLIRVSQETSPGSGNFALRGFVNPFSTGLDAAGYYAYGPVGYNGPDPELVADRSHLFFVDASDGLALFVVHDTNDGDSGHADMQFSLLEDTATILAQDDPGMGDLYSDLGTAFTTQHGWGPCCTDGLAIGSLDGFWTMNLEFTSYSGLDSCVAYDESGAAISLALATGQAVRLQAIPEPSHFVTLTGLVAVGLIGYWRRRRRQAA